MGNLAGKTLFITGASRGIGLAIALRAARDGANIVIAAKSGVANPKLPGTIHTAAALSRRRAVMRWRCKWIFAKRIKWSLPLHRQRNISAASISWSTTPARSGWPAPPIRR
jgi:hypothetical protein